MKWMPKGCTAYQHCVIVNRVGPLGWVQHCIVCQQLIEPGTEAVLFDKGHDLEFIVAAHGGCITSLAQHLQSDVERVRQFDAYRNWLKERYGVSE